MIKVILYAIFLLLTILVWVFSFPLWLKISVTVLGTLDIIATSYKQYD